MDLTSTQRQELAEIFDKLGLKRPEQQVYLDLLSQGISTATPLATRVSMPTTTVQSILQRLDRKGLVHVSKSKSRSTYEAKNPVALKNLLEQTLREVNHVIPLLKELQAETTSPTQIRVYSKERISDIFRLALQCKDKQIREIVAAKHLQAALGEKFHFTKRRIEAGITLQSLRVESEEIKRYSRETHQRELREAKFLPKEFTFTASILFWDDTVAFISAAPEQLAWVVKSKSIRIMYEQLFAMLWSMGRKMETGENPHIPR